MPSPDPEALETRRRASTRRSQSAETQKESPLAWMTFQRCILHVPQPAHRRIRDAFTLGKQVHAGQVRDSGEPYFTHCVAVATLLAEEGADEETLIAALLHDVLEDTVLSLSQIREQFGPKISYLIDGVTKLGKADFLDVVGTAEQARAERHQSIETLRKMFTYMQEDIRIIVIKLYDRLHNMRTIHSLSSDRKRALAEETMSVYTKVAGQLCMKQMHDELELLSLQCLQHEWMEALAREQFRVEEETKKVILHLKSMMQAEETLHVPLEYSPISLEWSRLLSKVQQQETQAVSPLAVAIVAPANEDCYRVLYFLHRLWQRETGSFDDFINCPQINGYQGLHTTIILQDGRRVQCRIRTPRMGEYARKGIMTSCFTGGGVGPMDWLASTLTLSQGLKRSEEFWEGLQSDILGESILLHGPGDRTFLVPKGSTALDGTFYCFGEDALRATSVAVNGRPVPFAETLKYADSLAMVRGDHLAVQRAWLDIVETGFATAKIRKALAAQSREKKLATGRQMLQDVMNERGKGLLEEFDERSMVRGLRSLGFPSLENACIAIAEGRFEPREIYSVIFEREMKKRIPESEKKRYFLHFLLEQDNIDALRQLVNVYQKYSINIGNIHIGFAPHTRTKRKFTILAHLSPDESEELRQDLTMAGMQSIQALSLAEHCWSQMALPILSVLWGLDCLLGKVLITSGVHPFDLTALRFAALFFLSACTVAFVRIHRSSAKLKWISPLNRYLYLAGGAIFVTALCSYIAVQYISAMAYALCMNIGVVSVLLYKSLCSRERSLPLQWTAATFLLFTFFLLYSETRSLLSTATLAGVGCGVGFAIYSAASRRYQLEESVRSRYPIFIFYFSSLALLLSLPLAYLSHFSLLRSPLLFPALIFVTFLTALPYLIYFALLKHRGQEVDWRYIPLFLVVMVLGELFIYQSRSWLLLVPLALAVAWQFSSMTSVQDVQSVSKH